MYNTRKEHCTKLAIYYILLLVCIISWWHKQMEILYALLALCVGNSPVNGDFPSQRPVTRSFDVFDLRMSKRLSKQSRHRWFETPSCSLWRHHKVLPVCCNGTGTIFPSCHWSNPERFQYINWITHTFNRMHVEIYHYQYRSCYVNVDIVFIILSLF